MMWQVIGIAWVSMLIGYIIGHGVGTKQAAAAASSLLDKLLRKCIECLPKNQRQMLIKEMREAVRSL